MLDKSSSIYYEDFESDSALTHLNTVDTNICLQSVFSFVLQMAGIVLDLPALTQILQEVPLHQKLDLEPELIQASVSWCPAHCGWVLFGRKCKLRKKETVA